MRIFISFRLTIPGRAAPLGIKPQNDFRLHAGLQSQRYNVNPFPKKCWSIAGRGVRMTDKTSLMFAPKLV